MAREVEELEFEPFELEEELDIDKSLFENLVSKEILTEEESTGVAEAYEAAVRSAVKNIITESVNPHYAKQLETLLSETKEELSEDLSNYMDYVVEEFVTENQEQIQAAETSKQDRALVEGLVSLFEEHYIDIPEGRQDIVESLSNDLKEANAELEESENKVIELRSKVNGMACERAFDQISEDLTESQKEKLMGLVEDLSVNDPEEFTRRAKNLKSNLVESSSSKSTKTDDYDDDLEEELDTSKSTGLDWLDEALAVTRKSSNRRAQAA